MKTSDSYKELYEARHEPENIRPIAEIYWRMMLLSAAVVVVLAIGCGIWEFSAVMATISSGTAVTSAPQQAPIDRAGLEKAINQFSQRRADYQYAAGNFATSTDPAK